MRSTAPARTTIRRTPVRRTRGAVVLVAVVAIVTAVAVPAGDRLRAAWPSGASPEAAVGSLVEAVRPGHREGGGTDGGELGGADGAVPDRTTVFDGSVPGVARLDPALRRALRRAATSARAAGLELEVDSGWRSPAYQRHLLREAIGTYGSEAEAARWVATPETSAHVSGDAVDVGPPAAAAWLAEHGAALGLCRIYGNEPWHFELRPDAADDGCPPTYADPTHDPRMRR